MILHYNGADFVHDMDCIYRGNVPSGIQDLYNGNISAWENGFGEQQAALTEHMQRNSANVYEYDLANRIKSSDWLTQASSSSFTDPGDFYQTAYTYDPNGNIMTLDRHGFDRDTLSSAMDVMNYTYETDKNRLIQVEDIAGMTYGTDFGRGGTTNYTYDKDGNLLADVKEGIDSIVWTHDGKVKRVSRDGINPREPGKTDFQYDAMRQRVVKTDNPSDGDPSSQYYVRDAGGNTIAVYTLANDVNELEYGSEGGEFCLSLTIDCFGGGLKTVEICMDEFTYDPATGHITFDSIRIPSCQPPDSCYTLLPITIHPDSLGQPIWGVTCEADFPLWFNWVNYEQPEESYQVLQLAEYNIYGSEGHGRFVTWKPDSVFADTVVDNYAQYGTDSVYYFREKTQIPRVIGEKEYEIKDHLGNVRMTFTDQKIPIDVNNLALGWNLTLLTVNNYYPFGMQMPGMTWKEGDGYRYGFNGMENDNEKYGDGNSIDFGARGYDPRIIRFRSIDPKYSKFAGFSSYSYAGNSPIALIDKAGEEMFNYSELPNVRTAIGILHQTELGHKILQAIIESSVIHVHINDGETTGAPGCFTSYEALTWDDGITQYFLDNGKYEIRPDRIPPEEYIKDEANWNYTAEVFRAAFNGINAKLNDVNATNGFVVLASSLDQAFWNITGYVATDIESMNRAAWIELSETLFHEIVSHILSVDPNHYISKEFKEWKADNLKRIENLGSTKIEHMFYNEEYKPKILRQLYSLTSEEIQQQVHDKPEDSNDSENSEEDESEKE